jgi:hypothetical protein
MKADCYMYSVSVDLQLGEFSCVIANYDSIVGAVGGGGIGG